MSSERRGATSSFYGFDQQSNAGILVSIGGNITDSYLYKSFGEELAVSGNTVNYLRFGGQVGYWRDAADRLYVRARHLRADLGRWMSRDLVGFEGGDWNLYGYVGNAVIIIIDPTGEKCECVLKFFIGKGGPKNKGQLTLTNSTTGDSLSVWGWSGISGYGIEYQCCHNYGPIPEGTYTIKRHCDYDKNRGDQCWMHTSKGKEKKYLGPCLPIPPKRVGCGCCGPRTGLFIHHVVSDVDGGDGTPQTEGCIGLKKDALDTFCRHFQECSLPVTLQVTYLHYKKRRGCCRRPPYTDYCPGYPRR